MRYPAIAFWVLSGLIACEAAEPRPPKTPAAVSVVSQEPDVAPEPQPATIADLVERDADIFGYLDAEEFRRGPLYRAIRNVVEAVPLARDPVRDLIQTCGFDPFEALLEISLSSRVRGGRPDLDTAVLAARTTTTPEATLECVGRLVPHLERTKVGGHPALAFADADGYVATVGPFLVFGRAQAVPRAIERLERGARVRVPDEMVYADLRASGTLVAERIVVSAAQTPRGTEWSVLARATSSQEAEKIENAVREGRQEFLEKLDGSDLESGAKSLVAELTRSVTFERRGVDLAGAFSFGSPEREAQILGELSRIIGPQIDQQLKADEVMDARRSVRMIADLLQEYAMNQAPPRFPESGPLVPATVPAASRYRSVESDWQQGGWKSISFHWAPPQTFAFGFETARGGRKVTVRALGDLDGDGQHSRIEAELEVVQDKSVSDPKFREHNPLE